MGTPWRRVVVSDFLLIEEVFDRTFAQANATDSIPGFSLANESWRD